MEKDADAYRTISEVAETLDIPPHVLRFWESKFPQIKPLKRGGGRRYYRRSDTDLLRAIRQLLYEDGYTIRGVQRLLKSRGAVAVASMDPSDRPSPQEVEAGPGGDDGRLAGGETPREFGPALARLRADIAACRHQLDEALGSMGRDGVAAP